MAWVWNVMLSFSDEEFWEDDEEDAREECAALVNINAWMPHGKLVDLTHPLASRNLAAIVTHPYNKPGAPTEILMIRTIEAVIDEEGKVQLLEAVRLPEARRALLTILEEPPSARDETALRRAEDFELVSAVAERVKQGLTERGHTPDEILQDFEQFRRTADHGNRG